MFDSVKQGGQTNGAVYLASLLVSLIAHAVILCVLVTIPLMFFNGLQAQELLTFLVGPPVPPAQPPPSPPQRSAAAVRHSALKAAYDVPRAIPNGIPPAADASPALPDPGLMIAAIPGINGSGLTGGTGKGSWSLLLDSLKLPEPPKPPSAPKPPVRVGVLEQSKLMHKVNPVYPPMAAKAHISGTVILEAAVDEEGNISALKVLGGHPFLVEAALQAVRQWRYSPTILNGEPVSVIATITVVFRLD